MMENDPRLGLQFYYPCLFVKWCYTSALSFSISDLKYEEFNLKEMLSAEI